MTDQEKRGNVIKTLELCTSKIETRTRVPCEVCPYHNDKYHGVLGDGCCNMRSLQRDILALLKAQEPKAVVGIADSDTIIAIGGCPACGKSIVNNSDDPTKYCKFCGQAVKWK